jgi:hypothetical protein
MLDIDGVLANFVAGFQAQAFASDGKKYPDAKVWNFPVEQWKWSKKRFLDQMKANGENGFYRTLPIYSSNVAAARDLLDVYPIEFYTTRPLAAQKDTEVWLTQWFGQPVVKSTRRNGWTLRMQESGVKSGGEAYFACLDDNTENAHGLARQPDGTGCENSFVLDRPYNQDCLAERTLSVMRFGMTIRGR